MPRTGGDGRQKRRAAASAATVGRGRDERSGRYEVGVEVPASVFARRASELAPEEDESLVDESFEDDESLVDESFEGDGSLVDESFEESDSRSLRRPWALAPWSFL